VRAHLWDGVATSRLRALLSDLATFACILAFAIKLKTALGNQHTLSHLMKTLIQDSTVYFFVMLTFNAAMLVYAIVARASLKNFPLVWVFAFVCPR
jgi:hypothetical protein